MRSPVMNNGATQNERSSSISPSSSLLRFSKSTRIIGHTDMSKMKREKKCLPGGFCWRFRLVVALRVGKRGLPQGGYDSGWLRGPLDPPEPYGRHWILLPCRLFFTCGDLGASSLGRRDTRLRQPLEVLVSLRSARQLGVRVLPLQAHPSRGRPSVNVLAKALVRLRRYVGLGAAGVRGVPIFFFARVSLEKGKGTLRSERRLDANRFLSGNK